MKWALRSFTTLWFAYAPLQQLLVLGLIGLHVLVLVPALARDELLLLLLLLRVAPALLDVHRDLAGLLQR